VKVESIDGLVLEAELDRPESARKIAVICHANPQMQGTMRSPLLLAIRDSLAVLEWGVLRFNYRGVGTSEGEFGGGSGEVADALGALNAARSEISGPIVLIGWSFGGAIAVRAAAQDGAVSACVAIAPAVEATDLSAAGELGLSAPILVVCGANDDTVSPESCRMWADASQAEYVEIPAANHFFWAKYEALTATIARWLEKVVG
jgi:uncharacterized protein